MQHYLIDRYQCFGSPFYPEDGGSRFLTEFGVISQKTIVLIDEGV
jgi:hypothetical protein